MLYKSVGIQVANSLSHHAAMQYTQSQIARLPVHKLWEVVGELGMVVPFIQGLCASRIGLSEVHLHAASTSEGIIFVKS